MNITIINEPNDDFIYEFTVASELSDGTYLFQGYFTNGFEAEKKALEIGGIIFHNVRIQGKKKKEKS